jgi:hypothetical protein
MADNTVKIGIGIDVNELKDDLSQVESLFRESTGTVAELWADAGEKITEALGKVLSQATSTGQQSAAQMNGAASSVASFAEGAAARLNVYLQVALLVIQAAKDIWEAHKRMREEAFNTEHQMAQLALSFDGEAHSLEIANLKLDDQISKLRGGVSHNRVKEAILEARDAADKLTASLEKALEEENKVLEKKVIGGLFEEIFGGGALTEGFKEVTNQMYEWRAAQDQLAMAENKLRDAKTKGEKDAAQQEVDTARRTAEEKLKTYRKTVEDELKAEVDKLEYFKRLNKAGGAGVGFIDDYTQRVALLTEYLHSLDQVGRIEKAQKENSEKRETVARLETKKEVDAETARDIGLEKQLAEEREKTGLAGLQKEKARISVMREDTEAQVDAQVRAATELAQKERDVKAAGLKEQKDLLDQWWASVDQKNAHNAQDYNTRTEVLNQQQLQLQKNFEAESEKIILEGEKKKTDIRVKAFERFIQDQEKAQDRWYAKEKTELDGEAELVKANASRGLITVQQERDQLKAIYDRELDDLRTKIEAQLRLEDRLRKALDANGMGPGSPEYQASLQRSRQLQDELDRSTAQFSNIISQLDVKLKGLSLTGQQFSQKLRTDMLNTINQLKVAWQGMIQQMNSGFISSFNKMLETGKGFGQGMIETFGKMAESLIDMFLKIAVEWIESQILMMVFGKTKTQTDSDANVARAQSLAAVAAEGAFAYYSAIFPPAAAAMASAQYAQGLLWAGLAAFELGGVVPQTGLALVHKGETILPASMSGKGFDGAIGGGLTVVVNHSVNAVDAESFQQHIRRHGNMIGNEVARVLKKRGIAAK